MAVRTVTLENGRQMPIDTWTPEEKEIFDLDFSRLIQTHFKDLPGNVASALEKMYMESKDAIALIGQACKKDISPSAGTFQGMEATTGYGMQLIRPDYIVPAAQGRNFAVTLSGKTAANWYGLYHDGTIGDAWNASPLYLRKELGLAWAGQLELGLSLMDEIQLEINSEPMPVHVTQVAMRLGDIPVYAFSVPEYVKPGTLYRSRFKINATGGNYVPVPLGVAFVKAEYMRAIDATQPSTSAP